MGGHTKLYDENRAFYEGNGYKMLHHTDFDYSILSRILSKVKSGKGDGSYSDCIIMADTETSKKNLNEIGENHVCAWTVSIRAYGLNIVTLYGHRPDTLIDCLQDLKDNLQGDEMYVYFHNLPYDYVFLRQFMYVKYGKPDKQLNVKSHYPLFICFHNGITFKDSLILAQRKLEKWAEDMNVEHKKAVGLWDYDKIRNQNEVFTKEELEYIEHDTLAGVECIDKLKTNLNKNLFSLPYTATGIVRGEVRKRGKMHGAHAAFLKQVLTFEQQLYFEEGFHGGYAHGNRHRIGELIRGLIKCKDFSSSYPFTMLAFKFPSEPFTPDPVSTIENILKYKDEYAYMLTLILIRPRLKDEYEAMPILQYSKCKKLLNPVCDNGRILCASYAEIVVTEQSLDLIAKQYDFDSYVITDCLSAAKDYLPRWFTDYVYELYEAKCTLKHSDPINYAISKGNLNAQYGNCVQRPLKDTIEEDYETGEFNTVEGVTKEAYEKWTKKRGNVLNYQIGVWVTEYALHNLFELGSCVNDHNDNWLYSDTDSIYALNWNEEKVAAYNQKCKDMLRANGYGPVIYEGEEFWPGIAECEAGKDEYTEFKVMGAKRYAGRKVKDGKVHITVAGVPKSGAACLDDDLNNFAKGCLFSGKKTGKKQHTYFFNNKIYTDANGNLTADSIDLSPCDYILDDIEVLDWKKIWEEEIEVQVYE